MAPDPNFDLIETGEWCEYAKHYREFEYGIEFWYCESPARSRHTCTNYTCPLDGKDRWRCLPRPVPLPAVGYLSMYPATRKAGL